MLATVVHFQVTKMLGSCINNYVPKHSTINSTNCTVASYYCGMTDDLDFRKQLGRKLHLKGYGENNLAGHIIIIYIPTSTS